MDAPHSIPTVKPILSILSILSIDTYSPTSGRERTPASAPSTLGTHE